MRNSRRRRLKTRRLITMCAVLAAVCAVIGIATAFCSRGESPVTVDASTITPVSELLEDETEFALESATEPELISLGEFTITAYCPCVTCCGEWSAEHPSRVGTGYVQKTSSGTVPEAGRTIGVDPDVIPYGTVVVIFGHEYIAEDSGAALDGNAIDIYFDSHDEALEFGRQTAEVFIKAETTE